MRIGSEAPASEGLVSDQLACADVATIGSIIQFGHPGMHCLIAARRLLRGKRSTY